MSVCEKAIFRIPVTRGRKILSLCWRGDELVDFATGGTCYRLDGTIELPNVYYAYHFDRAAVSRDGRYSVIYEALGTKGLILKGSKPVREINRSFYHTHVYEYPLLILHLPDGRLTIAHCPEAYNKIEIEEIESGRSLTIREGNTADVFHSRLQASPGGEYLLSAGWLWHPLDTVQLFNVRDALKSPTVLDNYIRLDLPEELFEVHAAAFQDDQTVIMVGDNGGETGEEVPFLIRYDLRTSRILSKTRMQETAGTIMAAGMEHIVGFYEHPKLIEVSSGKVVRSWPELDSGKQNSSIIHHADNMPPLAMDSQKMRFAIADAKGLTVIQLG